MVLHEGTAGQIAKRPLDILPEFGRAKTARTLAFDTFLRRGKKGKGEAVALRFDPWVGLAFGQKALHRQLPCQGVPARQPSCRTVGNKKGEHEAHLFYR